MTSKVYILVYFDRLEKNLRGHMKTHIVAKPYCCEVCELFTHGIQGLNEHITYAHVCNMVFK